jgi:hypothetical protein
LRKPWYTNFLIGLKDNRYNSFDQSADAVRKLGVMWPIIIYRFFFKMLILFTHA